MGTLAGSCSNMNLMHSMPKVMWRDSSDCAEKPNVTVEISPLCAAPDMKGTNNKLVSTYSNEKLTAVKNSNGPPLKASSKKDFGTDKYHMLSNQWLAECMPLKYLL